MSGCNVSVTLIIKITFTLMLLLLKIISISFNKNKILEMVIFFFYFKESNTIFPLNSFCIVEVTLELTSFKSSFATLARLGKTTGHNLIFIHWKLLFSAILNSTLQELKNCVTCISIMNCLFFCSFYHFFFYCRLPNLDNWCSSKIWMLFFSIISILFVFFSPTNLLWI